MAQMRSYPKYLFQLIESCIGRRVWEIGVGHGQYTDWLLEAGLDVLATDIDRECIQSLASRHPENAHLHIAEVDLTNEKSVRQVSTFAADSIVCLNVLEHIENDVQALRWIRESTASGAMLGLIVPAHPRLYGRMDSEAGHYRRYTRHDMARVLTSAGWNIRRLRYVNFVGAVGWWYHNRWRKNAGLADKSVNQQMRSADRWLPAVARMTDPLLGYVVGLSLVVHARA